MQTSTAAAVADQGSSALRSIEGASSEKRLVRSGRARLLFSCCKDDELRLPAAQHNRAQEPGSNRLLPPGFTLLELAVVLLIIGLILMIAMPNFGNFQGAELRSEARRLAARTHYLYEAAGGQKVILRLNFDISGSRYYVTRLDPLALRPVFKPDRGPAGGEVLLPADIRLRDVWVEGPGLFQRGLVASQFYPGGIADATVIHLADRNGDIM